MTTTYIQIQNLGYLELKENISIPLNYSIAEIQDISKRQGNYSKTIVVPGTANNNQIFSNLFDVNISDATFNINAKQRCQIIQNGISVMDGFLRLLNVNKLSPSLGIPDEFVEYEVQVTSGSGDFYSTLQEKLLEDLPLWDQFNHIYTLSAITATSAHTAADTYTYFLPFKSSVDYTVTDFAPAIYAKAYWDRIFLDSGYSYQWDSLEDCDFQNLIIPYNGDIPLSPITNNIRAGYTSGTSISYVLSATTFGSGFGLNVVTNELLYDDDTTPPNTDVNNDYNTTTGEYTSPLFKNVEFNISYKLQIQLIVPVDCQINPPGGSVTAPSTFGIRLFTTINNELTDIRAQNETPYFYEGGTGNIFFSAGTYTFDTIASANLISDLVPGQKVKPLVETSYQYTGVWFESGTTTPLAVSQIPYFIVTRRIDPTEFENNFFKTNINQSLTEGQIVDVKSFIPKQIKQRDFINGIVKMYNLFITPSPTLDNLLIIETRDEYYDSGAIKDWTNKLDINSDVTLEFLPDLQDKRLTLTYKQDNDQWNRQYQLGTNEIYGQLEYTFSTEFTQSTRKIENLFSPTPIVINSNGLAVPAIVNKNPKTNIRILRNNGWVDGEWVFIQSASTGTNLIVTQPVTLPKYPQALHFDDVFNPQIDINYGLTDYLYYSNYETLTNNNLYNKYWSRFINQIENGKLMTGIFYLTENDIANLDLRDKIWVHDTYWNINRVIDYNPNGNGLTKVELISIDDSTTFTSFPINRNNINDLGPKNNWVTNQVSIEAGPSQNNFGTTVTNTIVNGLDNTFQGGSRNNFVNGNGNNLGGRYSFVSGEDNTVSGDNIYLFGVSGQTVIGDGQAIFAVPVSATTISASTIFVGGSSTPMEPSVWGEGTGAIAGFAIKALNDSTTDATGDYAVAEGFNTLASGEAAHAEGGATIASGLGAHAEGNSSTASGDNSHAEGFNTTASGTDSHAEGSGSVASGSASHAEGLGTIASGNFGSHAEGSSTQALGNSCHAQGIGSIAEGLASHAGGNESRTQIDGEIASSCTSLGTVGQTQFGTFDGFTSTVNNTPTLLDFLSNNTGVNGWRPNFTASPTTAAAFRYLITCINLATGDSRIITGEGMIKWITGTPTLVFASIPSVNGDVALLGVTATPVASGNGLQFQVTGLAATSLTWRVRVDYTF